MKRRFALAGPLAILALVGCVMTIGSDPAVRLKNDLTFCQWEATALAIHPSYVQTWVDGCMADR